MARTKKGYPSDVSDEEWAFCAPYLTLMREDAPQGEYSLRDLFNALRYVIRAGCPWRMLPNSEASSAPLTPDFVSCSDMPTTMVRPT
jgi:transposase